MFKINKNIQGGTFKGLTSRNKCSVSHAKTYFMHMEVHLETYHFTICELLSIFF